VNRLSAYTVIRFSAAFRLEHGIRVSEHNVIYVTGASPMGSCDYMKMDYRIPK